MGADRLYARAEVGDACEELTRFGPVAGIMSCFALQQMPQPAAVLAGWVKALAPGISIHLSMSDADCSGSSLVLHSASDLFKPIQPTPWTQTVLGWQESS